MEGTVNPDPGAPLVEKDVKGEAAHINLPVVHALNQGQKF